MIAATASPNEPRADSCCSPAASALSLALKQEALDALEEYSGAITDATRFSDAVTTGGQRLPGLAGLHEAVRGRLDTVSFAMTTPAMRSG